MGDGMLCDLCDSQVEYSAEYDSYYCVSCNCWLEGNCKDPTCIFCKNRPEKPLPIIRNKTYNLPDENTPEVIEDQIKWMEEIVEKRNGDKK